MAGEMKAECSRAEMETSLPILYSAQFGNTTNLPGCLTYSDDNQICLINNASIYVLEMQSTACESSSQLFFSVSVLPNPKDDCLFDVGIDPSTFFQPPTRFQDSYAFSLDPSLNPNRGNAVPCCYAAAKWSPSHCFPSGRSMLATVSINGCVNIHGPERYTGKWKSLVNLTDYLYEKLRGNDYRDADTENERTEDSDTNKNSLSQQFTAYQRRQYYLAMKGVCWCPIPLACDNVKKSLCGAGGRNLNNLLLAMCNKLGWVFILRIQIDLSTEHVVPYLEHTIKPGFELASTLSWYQETASTKGYIAVSFANGCIKVCTLETSIEGTSSRRHNAQIYDLWTQNDLMAVKFMEWIKKDNQLFLVATKMTDILVFTVERDVNGMIIGHSCHLGPSKHHMPITALSCHEDRIATAGMDGITQSFLIGNEATRTLKNMCKAGFSCMGMQVSHNGLIMIQALSPTAVLHTQDRFNRPLESVAFPLVSMEEAARKLADPSQRLNLELCEFLRLMANHQSMPKPLQEMTKTDIREDTPLIQLQKIEFIKELIQSLESNSSDKSKEGAGKHQRWRFGLVRERLCKDQLNAALKMLSGGQELRQAGKQHLLLLADWLVLKSSAESNLELALSLYRRLNEIASIEKAKNAWNSRVSARVNQKASTSTEQGNPSSDIVQTKENCPMPCRETCPVCKSDIPLTNEFSGECEKSHHWKRCLCTLRILSSLRYRTCTCCHRHAQEKTLETDSTENQLFYSYVNTDYCLICNGRLSNS